MPTLSHIYPPSALRVRSGSLELLGIGDDEALALLKLAQEGIHAPDVMPFGVAWTDVRSDELPLNYLQWYWRGMASWSRDAWSLDLAVLLDGKVVGTQGVTTRDFLMLRSGETGSWLGRRFQGQGIGTAMRRAFCTFLFDHLGFTQITSGAFADNHASRRVSEKVGYRPNGSARYVRRGVLAEHVSFVLTPDTLIRGGPVEAEGVEPLRRFIGLDA